MQKYSRQRETIRNHLTGRMDHPTAEMIYTALKEEDPKLSLGTVYRNLALLTEQGEIRKIQTANGPDRYDGNRTEHYHFLCRKCCQIFDLYPKEPDELKIQRMGLLINHAGSYDQYFLNIFREEFPQYEITL